MLKYLKHKEIDKKKWDFCIQNSLNKKVYGLSTYLDAVCESWDAIVVNEYEAVFPIPLIRKFGISFCIQPPFCQQLGLFSTKESHFNLLPEIIKKLKRRFLYINLHLNNANICRLPVRKNYILDLNKPFAQIKNGYNTLCKRTLKKTDATRIKIENIDIKELIELYSSEINKKTPGFIEKHGDTLLNLIQKKSADFSITAKGIRNNNILEAGYLILNWEERFYFLFSASSLKGKEKGLMYKLIDAFIEENSEKNSILDFEGSELKGLEQFYKGFGSINEEYYKLKSSKIPFL